MTTGAITHPYYNQNFSVGRIAQQDHEYGFIIVEKQNNTYFHFRQVTALKNGKFIEQGILYNGNNKPRRVRPKAMVLGDIHPYDTNKDHERISIEQIRTLNPEAVFLHDIFNAKSISHWYKGNNKEWHKAYEQQGLNLETELKFTGKAITKYARETKGTVYVVASNHDEHLDRYLNEGRFVTDKGNDKLGAELYIQLLAGVNPLEYGIKKYVNLPSNVVFLERDQDLKIAGYQLANHGDLGANGGRGSPRSIEVANGKSITGHSHSAFKTRKTYRVGTSTNLRLSYNRGYSNWTNTNAVLYEDGNVQLLNTIRGKWRI